MVIGVASWPASAGRWLELALAALPGIELHVLRDQATPCDVLVVDGDAPGPHFIGAYRDLVAQGWEPFKFVLGSPQSPFAMAAPWDPERTVFVPKPFQVEAVRQMVSDRIQQMRERQRTGPAQGRATPARLGLGELSSLRLADLLQMLCLSAWTGRIEVISLAEGWSGEIYVNVGVLIHAETGRCLGEEACYRMLEWGRSEFRFLEEHPPVLQTIRTPWQSLLLESARRQDERGLGGGRAVG